jgi:hypothetical protein
MEKPQLRRIHRNVCEHRWEDVDDWARSFQELADLDDHELVELSRLSGTHSRYDD